MSAEIEEVLRQLDTLALVHDDEKRADMARQIRAGRERQRKITATRRYARLYAPLPEVDLQAVARRAANDLAAQGWDVDYLARRFGLPRKS